MCLVKVHLQTAGLAPILLALAQPVFDRYFGWSKETARLSTFTRQVFQVHGFFIAVILALMGWLSFYHADALLERTPLANAVLSGLAIFWILRALTQWFWYDSSVWRGSHFRTMMHGLFSLFWLYLAGVYSIARLR